MVVPLQLLLLAAVVVLAGFWMRFYAPVSPNLRDVSGGISYVMFFVLAFGAVTRKASSARIAIFVLAVTCCLEFLQLWHPVWLEMSRRTLPGRLLLGTTFEWTDFPPYFIGAAVGWAVCRALRKR